MSNFPSKVWTGDLFQAIIWHRNWRTILNSSSLSSLFWKNKWRKTVDFLINIFLSPGRHATPPQTNVLSQLCKNQRCSWRSKNLKDIRANVPDQNLKDIRANVLTRPFNVNYAWIGRDRAQLKSGQKSNVEHALSTTETPVHNTNVHNTNSHNTNVHNTDVYNTNVL